MYGRSAHYPLEPLAFIAYGFGNGNCVGIQVAFNVEDEVYGAFARRATELVMWATVFAEYLKCEIGVSCARWNSARGEHCHKVGYCGLTAQVRIKGCLEGHSLYS